MPGQLALERGGGRQDKTPGQKKGAPKGAPGDRSRGLFGLETVEPTRAARIIAAAMRLRLFERKAALDGARAPVEAKTDDFVRGHLKTPLRQWWRT